MIVIKSKIIRILIIINLTLLGFILLGRIHIVIRFTRAAGKTFLIPLFISVLFFYIVRPLNNNFIKKGISPGKASLLTLIICTFILSGLAYYFSNYAINQFKQIVQQLSVIVNDKKQIDGIINYINQFINSSEIYALAVGMVKNYIVHIGQNVIKLAHYFMDTFSIVFLIIVIIFYMLKDGHRFKESVLKLIPEKYKGLSDKILSESDSILSHYVTGQAKVALSLSIMIFTGYKIIGIPNAMLLSSITFILAFIPFVGFFISMIIPVVIALSMGIIMLGKLVAVFIIVQTLKGRVVVPAIMAKSMKIHPVTDIFLVLGAVAVAGPFAAFAVVPIYAILKNLILTLKREF